MNMKGRVKIVLEYKLGHVFIEHILNSLFINKYIVAYKNISKHGSKCTGGKSQARR